MTRKTSTAVAKPTVKAPIRTRVALPKPSETKRERVVVPNDSWVTAVIVDSEQATSPKGDMVRAQFEVTSPRAYRGLKLYITLHGGLDKTLDKLEKEFPGLNPLDADEFWEYLQAVPVRLHVGLETFDDGVEVRTYNRIASIYAPRLRPSEAAPADDAELPL